MTIRVRLAIAYSIAIAFTVSLLGGLAWWQFGQAVRGSFNQALAIRAAAAASDMENQGQVGIQETDQQIPTAVWVAIFDATGRLVDTTSDVPPGVASIPMVGSDLRDVQLGGTRFGIDVLHLADGSRIIAGASLAIVEEPLGHLAEFLALGGIAAATLSGLVGWQLAGHVLRPVAELTQDAAAIDLADLDERLPAPSRRDELGILAETLNRMLDRAADSVGRQRRFVAAASHDLRAPLARLSAELDLADDPRATPEELRTAVSAARTDVTALAALATSLLDLAASESGGRAILRSRVTVAELIESSLRLAAPIAASRRIEFHAETSTDKVKVDRTRMEQAIGNVLVNAATYGPAGGTVEIVARVTEAGASGPGSERRLWVEVLDRGPGVPASMVERIFEPFERGPKAPGPGAGLGLATASAAVNAHRGAIGVDPRPGGGSCFWLWVPLDQE